MLAYLFLFVAIFAEVHGDQPAQEHRRFQPVVADRGLPVGLRHLVCAAGAVDLAGHATDVAYALWSAIGTAAIVLIAVLFLGSPLSTAKVVGVGLIIAGVITLNLGRRPLTCPRAPARRPRDPAGRRRPS